MYKLACQKFIEICFCILNGPNILDELRGPHGLVEGKR